MNIIDYIVNIDSTKINPSNYSSPFPSFFSLPKYSYYENLPQKHYSRESSLNSYSERRLSRQSSSFLTNGVILKVSEEKILSIETTNRLIAFLFSITNREKNDHLLIFIYINVNVNLRTFLFPGYYSSSKIS